MPAQERPVQTATATEDARSVEAVERSLAIGRAVERLLALAARDDVVRAGLEALAQAWLGRERAFAGRQPPLEGAGEGPVAGDAVLDLLEPATAPPVEADPGPPLPESAQGVGMPSPRRRRPEREVVPMNRATFLALLEEVARDIPARDQGSLGVTLAGELTRDVAAEAGSPVTPPAPAVRAPLPGECDAGLPGIATRSRLRAAVARAVAQQERTGAPVEDTLLHRARSEGCALWMLHLVRADPSALESMAECLDALADTSDLVVLLAKHDPGNHARRAQAVRDLAAAQSALRVATGSLRQTPDEDQVAAFDWLKEATAAERIFVDRHMRLDDPLDPAHLADVMASVHAELDELGDQADRRESLKKRLQQVKYHAGRVAAGRGSAHDGDKIVEAVTALVLDGMPPSSLQLRGLLLPILDQLPSPDGRPAPYGRVVADLDEHRERVARPAPTARAAKRALSDDVRKVARLLHGTEAVLIGGERRPDADHALAGAFGLSGLEWLTLSDDPSLEEMERAIARPEVSIVLYLVRWSRHGYGEAAAFANEHGKPFVRVPGGYNPNAVAKAVLEQASERLTHRRDP